MAESRLTYRLLTGPDDHAFCQRVTDALAEGYVLYGSPAVTSNAGTVIAAQAVILPGFNAAQSNALSDGAQ